MNNEEIENTAKLKNVLMLDIETSGQNPGCRVMTLGAAGFSANGEYCEFYRRFDPVKLREAGFTDDVSTMDWWRKQTKEAFTEAFGGEDDPKEGIAAFKLFCYEHFKMQNGDGFQVWCCGLDFDFPILKEFLRHYGHHFPWKFYDQYDYRTLKKLFPKIRLCENNQEAHNAIEDARAQLCGLEEFFLSKKDGTL
jgi:hypothetical protein